MTRGEQSVARWLIPKGRGSNPPRNPKYCREVVGLRRPLRLYGVKPRVDRELSWIVAPWYLPHKRPIRFLLFGVLLVLPSPVHGRTMVSVPATDTPLTFEPPPNGIVVAAGATLNTRLEPIDAQTPPRDEGNRDPRLRIDSPRDGAVVASGETLQVTVSSPTRRYSSGSRRHGGRSKPTRKRPLCRRASRSRFRRTSHQVYTTVTRWAVGRLRAGCRVS